MTAVELPTLARALDDAVARLRRTPVRRLGANLPAPWGSPAGAARILGRALAVAAQGCEEADLPQPPAWRRLPVLADTAVGDQLAVLAHDFLAAAGSAPPQVWTPDGRAPLVDVLADVSATVEEVARLL